jgi:hypothetical protein
LQEQGASLVGLAADRYAGLSSDVVLAGVEQNQDGHERRGDQPDPIQNAT